MYGFLLSIMIGCAPSSTPKKSFKPTRAKLNMLFVNNTDKVHFYYTSNGKKNSKFVDKYLFNNDRNLYTIRNNHYTHGQLPHPSFTYWAMSDNTILLRQYSPIAYFDTLLYPVSMYHFASKPDKKGDVINFVIVKNKFDRKSVFKKKKSIPVAKTIKKKKIATNYKKKPVQKSSSTENAYYLSVRGAATGRIVGVVALGKYSKNRSNAVKYIKRSCSSSYNNKISRNACIRAAVAKLR